MRFTCPRPGRSRSRAAPGSASSCSRTAPRRSPPAAPTIARSQSRRAGPTTARHRSCARRSGERPLRIVERSPTRLVDQRGPETIPRRGRADVSRQDPHDGTHKRDRHPFEISDRVARQALVRPYLRGRHAPLDPAAADLHARSVGVGSARRRRDGQRAVREARARSDRIACSGSSATARRLRSRAVPLDLDDPDLLLSSGLSPSPANGRFHLQMVYAVCSLTYAAFRRALGREIAWATDAGPTTARCGWSVRPFGFEGTNAGYSREAGDLSFGYFTAGDHAAGFTLRDGLISTALSHDIVAHETTHALLDGLRSSFMDPSNVDVPAFHEAFSDLVALFLHFTYADVVERGIRESRGGFARGMLLTDLAREFGYARSKTGEGGGAAIGRGRGRRRGVRLRCAAAVRRNAGRVGAARLRPEAGAAHAGLGAGVGGVRGVRHDREAQDRALLPDRRTRSAEPRDRGAERRPDQGDRAGGERRRQPVPQHLHSRRSITARPPTWSSASTCAR